MNEDEPTSAEQSLDKQIDEFFSQKAIGETAANFLTEIDYEAE